MRHVYGVLGIFVIVSLGLIVVTMPSFFPCVYAGESATDTGAKGNDGKAKYELSEKYRKGEGVEQDDKKAFSYCREAANANYPPACRALGKYYLNGKGTDANPVEAVKWFQRAASMADDDAQYWLARCYAEGTGTDSNPEKAVKLFQTLANKDNTKACFLVGKCYQTGFGVRAASDQVARQNYVRAIKDNMRPGMTMDELVNEAKQKFPKEDAWFDKLVDKLNKFSKQTNTNSEELKCKYLVIDLSAGVKAERYPCYEAETMPHPQTVPSHQLWMRRIPAGRFNMGDNVGNGKEEDESPTHPVELTNDFYIGVFPVTQRQWELVMGNNPSYHQTKTGTKAPVEQVAYDDICGRNRLWPESRNNELIDLVAPYSFLGRMRERTGMKFDLPTEAQWEYACRAGTTTNFNNGKNMVAQTHNSRDPNLDKVAWYLANSGNTTHPVGGKKPNAWGVYDMHGNVWEWCRDWYAATFYEISPPKDPIGPAIRGSQMLNRGSLFRVVRGGYFGCSARDCRSAWRSGRLPDSKEARLGFRLFLPSGQR